MNNKPKVPWYKKWWLLVLIVLGVFIALAVIFPSLEDPNPNKDKEIQTVEIKETKETEENLPEYSKIESFGDTDTAFLQEHHYKYNISRKPSISEVKMIISDLLNTCPNNKICNFYLWTALEKFTYRDTSVSDAPAYAENNKDSLIGFLNSGGLFWYYGTKNSWISD